jgi:hypothetical protein
MSRTACFLLLLGVWRTANSLGPHNCPPLQGETGAQESSYLGREEHSRYPRVHRRPRRAASRATRGRPAAPAQPLRGLRPVRMSFYTAARDGQVELLKHHLQNGADVHQRFNNDRTALHFA